MLRKTLRLNLKRDFKFVVSGKRLETPSFKLYLKKGPNITPLVGIATSKKYFKKAHERNRARRKTAEVIQNLYSSLNNNLNLVIMPKAIVLEKSINELNLELTNVKDLYKSY